MNKKQLNVAKNYSLRSVIKSHGWSDLLPFQVTSPTSIRFAFRAEKGLSLVQLEEKNAKIVIASSLALTKKDSQIISSMFAFGEQLEGFEEMALKHQRGWVRDLKLGRMLRCQSVFEDLVKYILTTNCSWANTRKMVLHLCTNLGEKVDDLYCFPTPQKMAQKNETYYREKIRAGYRSAHLVTLSKAVARGDLKIEGWRTSQLDYTTLRKQLLEIGGVGPYVAENMLRLLGRYEGLGLDSWVRAKLAQMWERQATPTDQQILKKYETYGKFKGLILWFDVTKEWHA